MSNEQAVAKVDETKPELGQLIGGKIYVQRTIKRRQEVIDEKYEEELILTEHFTEQPSHVNVKIGLTKCPRQFESVRIDVGLTVPCYKAEVKAAISQMTDMIIAEVKTQMDDAMKVLGA